MQSLANGKISMGFQKLIYHSNVMGYFQFRFVSMILYLNILGIGSPGPIQKLKSIDTNQRYGPRYGYLKCFKTNLSIKFKRGVKSLLRVLHFFVVNVRHYRLSEEEVYKCRIITFIILGTSHAKIKTLLQYICIKHILPSKNLVCKCLYSLPYQVMTSHYVAHEYVISSKSLFCGFM